MPFSRLLPLTLLAALLSLAAGCNSQPSKPPAHPDHPAHGRDPAMPETAPIPAAEGILDLRRQPGIDDLLPQLLTRRVVYVGETHTEMAHHDKQLEVIEKLHASGVPLAIGMEMFQAPFQSHLDRYIAGESDEQALLLDSEWYDRWGYDYALYRPILRFALEHGIPLVALNIPRETVDAIRAKGMNGLSESEQATLPKEIDRSDKAYEARLRQVFEAHPGAESRDFQRFLEIQLAWDEGMAQQVANYLEEHPEHHMVVIAGSGHLAFGSGIPSRVERRLGEPGFIFLPGNQHDVEPGLADFVYFTRSLPAPPRPLLGVLLEQHESGLLITQVFPGKGAAQAGLRDGDRILEVNGHSISSVGQLKARLHGFSPGDLVTVEIFRPDADDNGKRMRIDVTLGN